MTTTFALGLTKTAVEGTLSLVKSAVEEEVELKVKVQNDLMFIIDEFEMMRAFLRVANKERVGNDEVVLTWVRQLRSLAFDVEDCVELVVHLEIKPPSCGGYLRRMLHKVKVYCCAPPLPGTLDLDDAVAEIKQLKARVQDVSQRSTRYNNLISNSNDIQQGPPAEELDCSTRASFSILRDAWVASGRWCHNHNMCNLQELISREGDDLHVISVGGGGGGGGDLGTASIIRKAYRDPKICENFKNRAWVKLTHPFNHDEFIKSMLTQLCATSHQANTSVDFWTRMDLMKAELVQQMSEQRYLVVLQDVFTSQDWDVIRMYLLDNNNGSRIVVSTPQLGIALLCTGEPYQVSELQHFSDGRFICAFFKKMQSTMDHFKCQLRRSGGMISMWGVFDGFLDRQRAINNHGKEAVWQDFRNRRGSHWGGNRRGGHLGGNRRGGLVLDPLWLLKMRFSKGKLPYTHKVVDIMYKGIINRLKEFDGIKFGRHSWVDVPYPFDLEVFAQRLFLNFYSDDIRRGEIMEVGNKGMAGLIEQCRRFLFEEDCLVVINGLWSTDDWDQIESNFLVVPPSEPASSRTTKGCILVVTAKEAVAMHCVKDDAAAAFHVKHLEADTAIVNLIEKGTWYCELGQVSARCGPYHQSKVLLEEGKKGRLFYDKRDDTYEWEKVVSRRPFYTSDLIGMESGLVMVSGKNIAAVRTKAFLKTAYHQDGRLMKLPRRS